MSSVFHLVPGLGLDLEFGVVLGLEKVTERSRPRTLSRGL